MLLLLAAHPLLTMHARMLSIFLLLLLGLGYHIYYNGVDDMIIIMLTIFDEGWKVTLSRLGALFHSSHLGSEFRVLVLRMSVPNRVWDAMRSPLLTYLASNISSGGPS